MKLDDLIGLQVIYKERIRLITNVKIYISLLETNIYIKFRGVGYYINIEELKSINKCLNLLYL